MGLVLDKNKQTGFTDSQENTWTDPYLVVMSEIQELIVVSGISYLIIKPIVYIYENKEAYLEPPIKHKYPVFNDINISTYNIEFQESSTDDYIIIESYIYVNEIYSNWKDE